MTEYERAEEDAEVEKRLKDWDSAQPEAEQEQREAQIQETAKKDMATAQSVIGTMAHGALQAGAYVGDKIGLDESATALRHYLDGSGKDRIVSPAEALQRPGIKAAQKQALDNFNYLISIDRHKDNPGARINPKLDYRGQLLNMKDGSKLKLPIPPDYAEGSIKAGTHFARGNIDDSQSIGSTKYILSSPEGFTAERRGDTITVYGRVENTFEDQYNFDNQGPLNALPNAAQEAGARTYTYRMRSFGSMMKSQFKINKNGEINLIKSELKDLPPDQHEKIYGYRK